MSTSAESQTVIGAEQIEATEIRENLREEYNDPVGFDELFDRIIEAETIDDWSRILGDYLAWGNRKITDTTAIFNLNAAHDCPNRETQENGESETGLCQVPWDLCYAAKAERMYDESFNYRRRQEFLWDTLDATTFAKAFIKVVERKMKFGNLDDYSKVDLRLSESGDFRHNQDIYKANEIARIIGEKGVTTYTYSASYKLPAWFEADHITLMQSVDTEKAGEYGDKEYKAFHLSKEELEETEQIADLAPEGTVWCPHDLEKRQKDINSEEAISCGDCRLCLEPEGPDVAIPLHQ